LFIIFPLATIHQPQFARKIANEKKTSEISAIFSKRMPPPLKKKCPSWEVAVASACTVAQEVSATAHSFVPRKKPGRRVRCSIWELRNLKIISENHLSKSMLQFF